MDEVHTLLGVCPQFDTVWPELTVEEHCPGPPGAFKQP
jgi:hypothetical protein